MQLSALCCSLARAITIHAWRTRQELSHSGSLESIVRYTAAKKAQTRAKGYATVFVATFQAHLEDTASIMFGNIDILWFISAHGSELAREMGLLPYSPRAGCWTAFQPVLLDTFVFALPTHLWNNTHLSQTAAGQLPVCKKASSQLGEGRRCKSCSLLGPC
jgi:hypothetical protein